MPNLESGKFASHFLLLFGVALSIFLLMSTSYIALKLGAAPWPIIFSVIVSGAILKLINRKRGINIHEVNVAQAGGSIGGLVAAGVAFTLPGILYLNQTKGLHIELPEPWILGLVFAVAGILGLILSVPLKYTFIDEENLPFPAGTAGAELLKLGKTGSKEIYVQAFSQASRSISSDTSYICSDPIAAYDFLHFTHTLT